MMNELKKEGLEMKTYIIDYVVGNTYKVKKIKAKTVASAIKKARVKNIVDIQIEDGN